MTQSAAPVLTPEEQAQVMDIQDRLIELFVGRDRAAAAGNRSHAEALQGNIDELLRERDDIKMWAAK